MRLGDTDMKTKLDNNASIYSKADNRTGKEKWKELKGRARWQYFKDYILGRLIAIFLVGGLLISLVISIFKPKPDDVLYTVVMNNPFTDEAVTSLTSELTKLLIPDPEKEQVFFDTDYYLSTDEYNTRMKFSTLIAAGQIDCVILPLSELQADVNSGLALNLNDELPRELLLQAQKSGLLIEVTPRETDAAMSEEIIAAQGISSPYALDVTSMVGTLSGYEPRSRYAMIILVNSKHIGNGIEFMRYVVSNFPNS